MVVKYLQSNQIKPRLKAFALHLLISGTIFLTTALLLIYWFFPSAHFKINGGIQGLMIMFAIDIIIGPVLTLLVYNPLKLKKEKLLDISTIILIQSIALTYGFYNVYQQRPLFLLLHPAGVIETISERNLNNKKLYQYAKNYPKFTGLPLVSFNPNDNAQLGIVTPHYQYADAVEKQNVIIKDLDNQQKEQWKNFQKNYQGQAIIVQLIGSYQTKWYVIDNDFKILTELGTRPTLNKID